MGDSQHGGRARSRGQLGPARDAPPKHLHPAQEEHFEVLSEELRVEVDGTQRTLAAGDAIDVPSGAVHRMWNAGDEPASAIWRTSPAGRTAHWFADLAALGRLRGYRLPGTEGWEPERSLRNSSSA